MNFLRTSFGLSGIIFSLLFTAQVSAVTAAGSPKCFVIGGNVVTAWQATDDEYDAVIIAAIGTTSTSPGAWEYAVISDGISDVQNSIPYMFTNTNGDVVVLWEYVDEYSNYWVAASVLPAGSTAGTDWVSATISTSDDNAGFFDQTASIDNDGNILATWTAYNSLLNTTQVRGATASIALGVVSSWSSPFTISP